MCLIKSFLILILVNYSICRNHTFSAVYETRANIPLIACPLKVGGILSIQLWNLKNIPQDKDDMFGFSLHKTDKAIDSSILEAQKDECLLNGFRTADVYPAVYFIMDLRRKLMKVVCNDAWQEPLNLFTSIENIPEGQLKASLTGNDSPQYYCSTTFFPIVSKDINGVTYFNASFVLTIASESQEGLYDLYFHSCPMDRTKKHSYDFTIQLSEKGEVVLDIFDLIYDIVGVICMGIGLILAIALSKSKHRILRIHYLIICLLLMKGIALYMKGMHYFFANWDYEYTLICEVLNFIVGSLTIATLLLVACGWEIIKKILARREMILVHFVACMQILSGIAAIVSRIKEDECFDYCPWRKIRISTDLICNICLLVPAVWNIRHLGTSNASALRLYRSLFVILIAYIYTSRIMVYLVKITITYKYEWMAELLKDVGTYLLIVLIAYKCRPSAIDSYIPVSRVDDDDALIDESTDDETVSDDVENRK